MGTCVNLYASSSWEFKFAVHPMIAISSIVSAAVKHRQVYLQNGMNGLGSESFLKQPRENIVHMCVSRNCCFEVFVNKLSGV